LALAVAGAFFSTKPFGRHLVYGATLLLSLLMLLVAGETLASGAGREPLVLPLGLPWIGTRFHVDALSAFFLVVVNLAAAAASLYGFGYGRTEHDPERVLPFFPAFLSGMNLVLIADDAYTFLLSWEFMSLASWALVMAHHREDQNARAGYVYLVMASFGTMALLVAFALLAGPDGRYGFEAVRAAPPAAGVAILAFVAALIGAGSKAGLAPLHVWLPLAHPAAPSHVSALMSGAMTKVAVYAFIRVAFDLIGPPDWRLVARTRRRRGRQRHCAVDAQLRHPGSASARRRRLRRARLLRRRTVGRRLHARRLRRRSRRQPLQTPDLILQLLGFALGRSQRRGQLLVLFAEPLNLADQSANQPDQFGRAQSLKRINEVGRHPRLESSLR